MTQFTLPSDAIEGIAPLGRLDVSEAKMLAGELQQGLTTSFSFARDVSLLVSTSSVVSLDVTQRELLADAIVGLHYIKLGLASKSDDSFVAELTGAVQASNANPLSSEELAVLAANIATFLSIRQLRASVKAHHLRIDQGSVFIRSQIFTDIRPVFDDDLDRPLLASLLTHTIKVTFQTNSNRSESIFLAADSDDLLALQRDIERALKKASAIAKLIATNKDQFGPALDLEESE